jgi:hypothetical protein
MITKDILIEIYKLNNLVSNITYVTESYNDYGDDYSCVRQKGLVAIPGLVGAFEMNGKTFYSVEYVCNDGYQKFYASFEINPDYSFSTVSVNIEAKPIKLKSLLTSEEIDQIINEFVLDETVSSGSFPFDPGLLIELFAAEVEYSKSEFCKYMDFESKKMVRKGMTEKFASREMVDFFIRTIDFDLNTVEFDHIHNGVKYHLVPMYHNGQYQIRIKIV